MEVVAPVVEIVVVAFNPLHKKVLETPSLREAVQRITEITISVPQETMEKLADLAIIDLVVHYTKAEVSETKDLGFVLEDIIDNSSVAVLVVPHEPSVAI